MGQIQSAYAARLGALWCVSLGVLTKSKHLRQRGVDLERICQRLGTPWADFVHLEIKLRGGT